MNTSAETPLILETGDLAAAPAMSDLCLVDLSDAEHYLAGHIPGAVHLPFSRLLRAEPPIMGLLPDAESLAQTLSAIGLQRRDHVVAYDNTGGGRASRLLWTLDVIGHPRFSLLNGGIAAWRAEGRPLENGEVEPTTSDYPVDIPAQPDARADKAFLLEHLEQPQLRVLDARSTGEFLGDDVRAARGGHIPGARHLEWTELLDPDNHGRLRDSDKLKEMLLDRDVRPEHEIVTHCQTHHRSALNWLALRALGYPRVRGYDGSWSEWGNDPDTPITGDR